MPAWRHVTESDGRTRRRFAGQGKRGAPASWALAAVDLGHAIAALTRAREAFQAAGEQPDRRSREAVLAEAREQLDLGRRFVADVAKRQRRGPKPKRRPVRAVVTVQLRLL